jgi:hypothetical protein
MMINKTFLYALWLLTAFHGVASDELNMAEYGDFFNYNDHPNYYRRPSNWGQGQGQGFGLDRGFADGRKRYNEGSRYAIGSGYAYQSRFGQDNGFGHGFGYGMGGGFALNDHESMLGTGYGTGGYGDPTTYSSAKLQVCDSRAVDQSNCSAKDPDAGKRQWRYVRNMGWVQMTNPGAARKDWLDYRRVLGWPFHATYGKLIY